MFLILIASFVGAGAEVRGFESDSYRDFIQSHGLETSAEKAEPDYRLRPGGPRNIEAFAMGYDLAAPPSAEERPRLERGSDGRMTLVYPVVRERSTSVRIQAVYTTDMVDWASAGVIDERIGHRGGRDWRRAVFPETDTRQFAAALRIEYSYGEDEIRPLASEGDEQAVAADYQSDCCSVVTDPVGYVTMFVYGGGEERRSYSALSVPLLRSTMMAGRVEEVDGNRIVLNWRDDDPPDLGPTGNGRATHFLEVREGGQPGRLVDVAEWDGESLFLAENVEEREILSPGDAIGVREHWTLDTFFFSTTSDADVRGSSVASEADQAKVFDPVTQQFETFWYWSDGSESGWRDEDGEVADDLVVYPARGLVVSRLAPEDLSFIVLGEVRMTPLQAEVLPGFNVLPNPFPAGYTLADTGLIESGLQGAEFQEAADSIQAPQTGGGFELYWLSTMEGSAGYVDFRYQLAGDTVFLDAGQGFVLERKGEEGFWWTSPVPYFLQ